MIYLIHEIKPEHIDFINSLENVVYLDDYTGKENVITFDGPYESLYKNLDRINKPFEVFVLWNNLGSDKLRNADERFCTLEELLEIQKKGRLQWHSRSHVDMRGDFELYELIPAFKCEWFAYPYGEYTEDLKKVVETYYIGAVSVHQGDDTQYALKRKEI